MTPLFSIYRSELENLKNKINNSFLGEDYFLQIDEVMEQTVFFHFYHTFESGNKYTTTSAANQIIEWGSRLVSWESTPKG